MDDMSNLEPVDSDEEYDRYNTKKFQKSLDEFKGFCNFFVLKNVKPNTKLLN